PNGGQSPSLSGAWRVRSVHRAASGSWMPRSLRSLMRSLPTLPPCMRQSRRLLLVSGFVVPTVLIGTVLTAAPAMATTATDKSAVTSAFGAGTGVALTDDYAGAALVASDDTQEVAAGTTDTIDLNGHTLDLDRIVVDAGAKLVVTDTA